MFLMTLFDILLSDSVWYERVSFRVGFLRLEKGVILVIFLRAGLFTFETWGSTCEATLENQTQYLQLKSIATKQANDVLWIILIFDKL